MKVTKELKALIQRELSARRNKELSDRNRANEESAQFREEVIRGKNAYKRFMEAYQDLAKTLDAYTGGDTGVKKSWDWVQASGYIKKISRGESGHLVTAESAKLSTRLEDEVDLVVIKVSYGKDLDEAIAILAQYGIKL